jgi:magnesium transporter
VLGHLIGPDITEMIRNRQFNELRRALASFGPATIADIFVDMAAEDVAVMFRILPRQLAADIFEYLSLESQEALLHSLGKDEVAVVLNEMDPDDRTALLEELPGAATQRLISLLSPDERAVAVRLLGYPVESVGRRMTPDYVALRPEWTVGHVLEHIRKVGRDKETLNVLYVIDERGVLLDDLRLREMILADPASHVSDLMDRSFVALRADQDQEECVRLFQKFDRVALPVVDTDGLLVGIVTVDDVMDVAEQEATEDMQKMGAVSALDAPYMNVSFFTMMRKRAMWLSVLFVGQMLTASAMGYFEEEIAKAVVLVVFLPLIISSGGNSGSQATSLIIRAVALGEVKLSDWWKVLYRELGAGLALGGVLALLAFLRIFFWPWSEGDYGEHYRLIGVAVAASLLGVVIYGTTIGAMLPLVLRRLGFDPAVSSAPLIATLVDVSGILIYFSIAAVVLRGSLL